MELRAMTKRGFLFLENLDFEKADIFFENALNEDPEDSYAYIGKLLVELKLTKIDELENQNDLFDNNRNYELAYRFADSDLKIELDRYCNKVHSNMKIKEKEKQDQNYNIAIMHKNSAKTKQEYSEAIKDLLRVGVDYKGVKEDIEYCRAKMIELDYDYCLKSLIEIALLPDNQMKIDKYEDIKRRLKLLGDYKDSKTKTSEIQNEIQIVNQKIKKYNQEIYLKKQKSKFRKIICAICVVILIIVIVLVAFFVSKSNQNKTMDSYIESGKLSEAYSLYNEKKNFFKEERVEELIKQCVISNDFETLIEIDHDVSENTDSMNVVNIIKENIKKEQYDDYYNAVLNYYDFGDNFLLAAAIYKQHNLLIFLSEDYKNMKKINALYDLLVSYGFNTTNYYTFLNSEFPDSCLDDIVNYCEYYQVNNYLVGNLSFMNGKWSDGDGNYIEFYNDSGCRYNIPGAKNYDYFSIENGVYSLKKEGNPENSVDCFKFTLVSKNKMKVYNYINNKTYTMTR